MKRGKSRIEAKKHLLFAITLNDLHFQNNILKISISNDAVVFLLQSSRWLLYRPIASRSALDFARASFVFRNPLITQRSKSKRDLAIWRYLESNSKGYNPFQNAKKMYVHKVPNLTWIRLNFSEDCRTRLKNFSLKAPAKGFKAAELQNFWSVLLYSDQFWSVPTNYDIFAVFWSVLLNSDQFCSILISFTLFWSVLLYSDQFWPVPTNYFKFCSILISLALF